MFPWEQESCAREQSLAAEVEMSQSDDTFTSKPEWYSTSYYLSVLILYIISQFMGICELRSDLEAFLGIDMQPRER